MSGGSLVFVDQAAQNRFSTDLASAEICREDAGSRLRVRNALADALMRPGGVVVLLVLSQDSAHVSLVENEASVLRISEIPRCRSLKFPGGRAVRRAWDELTELSGAGLPSG